MPTLSVIIPVYNVAPYLRACLDSVCIAVANAQKAFPDFTAEVICVDDGSTDGCSVILDEYLEKVERKGGCGEWSGQPSSGSATSDVHLHLLSPPPLVFRIIHQKNAGVSAARNAALDVATGEWIFFLDSDDSIPANAFVEIKKRLERLSEIDSIGICMYKDRVRDATMESCRSLSDFVVTGDQILGSESTIISAYRWLALDKFYRRRVIEKLRLRFKIGLCVGEDVQFAQLFLAQCENVLLCPSLMGYEYRTRGHSVMERKYDSLVHDPLERFVQLHKIWERSRKPGLCRLIVKLASETVSYGKEKIYSEVVRSKAIRLLVESKVFSDDMMRFLIMHGTTKGRIFALLYKMSPRLGREKLLEVI